MKHSDKVYKLLAFSGWSQDRLADLVGVSTPTLNKWYLGKDTPHEKHAETINWLYAQLVEPYLCELEAKADELAKKLLTKQIKALPENNVCQA